MCGGGGGGGAGLKHFYCWEDGPGPEAKKYFVFNSAEHEIFLANEYENANNSFEFHIFNRENFMPCLQINFFGAIQKTNYAL